MHGISNNVICATSKASDQPAHTQSNQSICSLLEYSMSVKLLTEHHLEFLSLKGGCTGSSESKPVKMSHCWKSHAMAQLIFFYSFQSDVPIDLLDVEKNSAVVSYSACSPEVTNIIMLFIKCFCIGQGCGNTMPNLSDLVPFHSGQVENFYLLVLGQV